MPKNPTPMPKPKEVKEAPVLGPYDLWGQIDRGSGIFAVVDHHRNHQWTGGTADIPPETPLGRYTAEDVDALAIVFHDQSRFNYFRDYIRGCQARLTEDSKQNRHLFEKEKLASANVLQAQLTSEGKPLVPEAELQTALKMQMDDWDKNNNPQTATFYLDVIDLNSKNGE